MPQHVVCQSGVYNEQPNSLYFRHFLLNCFWMRLSSVACCMSVNTWGVKFTKGTYCTFTTGYLCQHFRAILSFGVVSISLFLEVIVVTQDACILSEFALSRHAGTCWDFNCIICPQNCAFYLYGFLHLRGLIIIAMTNNIYWLLINYLTL